MWRTPASQYSSATASISSRVASTQVRCAAAGMLGLARDPRDRRVGALARRCRPRHRSPTRSAGRAAPASATDSHSVSSIFSVLGGKNSNDTATSPATSANSGAPARAAPRHLVDRMRHAAFTLRTGAPTLARQPQFHRQFAALQRLDPHRREPRARRTSRASARPKSRAAHARRASRSSSRSCGAKSTISNRPPGAQHARRLGDRRAGLLREMQHMVEDREVRRAVAERQRVEIGLAQFGMVEPASASLARASRSISRAAVDPQRMVAPARANSSSIRPVPVPISISRPTRAVAEHRGHRRLDLAPRRYGASGSHPIRRHCASNQPAAAPRDRRAPPPAAPRRPSAQ